MITEKESVLVHITYDACGHKFVVISPGIFDPAGIYFSTGVRAIDGRVYVNETFSKCPTCRRR